MGCASSKRIEASVVDIYKPPPSSFAVFNINSIQEPWLTTEPEEEEEEEKEEHQQQEDKPPLAAPSSNVPTPLLEKINKFETMAVAPRSWDEFSKALLEKDLIKPNKQPLVATSSQAGDVPDKTSSKPAQAGKRFSFHTLEELEAKLSSKTPENNNTTKLKKAGESMKAESADRVESRVVAFGGRVSNSVKENPFIVRDRMEREKEGKKAAYERMMNYKRDPLSGYPDKCPPGGENSLVVYTTSLRGVRRTYEDCTRLRSIFEGHRVVFDERDVSLHGEFLGELKELVGEGVGVPRVFLMGKYLGGVEEVVELNESGRLGRMLGWARVETGLGWQACEGCGGARFVPCLVCGGSCKVVVVEGNGSGVKQRCGSCNENGLVRCPTCH